MHHFTHKNHGTAILAWIIGIAVCGPSLSAHANAEPFIFPSGRIVPAGPPPAPNVTAPRPATVADQERLARFQMMQSEVLEHAYAGNGARAWATANAWHAYEGFNERAEAVVAAMLTIAAHRALRNGDSDPAMALAVETQKRLEERLLDLLHGHSDSEDDANAEHAPLLMALGSLYERIFDRPTEAAALYAEALALDPSRRELKNALARLARVQGIHGFDAPDRVVPERERVDPRVRNVLGDSEDE